MRLKRVPAGFTDDAFDPGAIGWAHLLADERAVAAYGADGLLWAINDPMLALVGWPIEEIDARGWIACLYASQEEQGRTLHNAGELSRPGGLPRRHTRPARRGDGTQVLIDMISTPLMLPDGRRGVFAIAIDVTRRGRPIGGARGFRELVEDAPDILLRVEVATGACLFVSRALERILGYHPDELYRHPTLLEERLTPASRAPFAEARQAVLRGEPQWLVVECLRKDGAPVTLHQALYPIRDASGTVVAIEGVARDLTAVRALERQLEEKVAELRARNAELASLDRLKSQLLANVSHELRTPLVTIKGYNELMLRGSMGPISDPMRRALDASAASIHRLVDLIENLLDFARREEGNLALHRTRLDARLPCREAVEHVGPRMADKGLALEVHLGSRPLEVDGDRTRLAQVVRALLSNAEKFCPAPGRVRLAATLEGAAVVLRVSDTGIGIPAEAQGKIFDRFFQVDASATRRYGGAGLGLSLAREIVTLHDGSIEVESEEGRGSTFTVRLPQASPAGAGRGAHPVVLLGAGPAQAAPLRARLEAEGLTVLVSSGGGEVLRLARRHRPEAVVLAQSHLLLDTIAALHHDPDTTGIPVVAMVHADRREAVLPIADYVVSLEEAPRLADAIRRLLGVEPPGAGESPAARARVLVVDDEPEVVDFTRFVLEREGYEVVAAASGEAALDLLSRPGRLPDLVVLDLALEGLDGYELCRRLKADPRTQPVPLLLVTAMEGEGVQRGAFEAGAEGLVTRPFGVEDFLQKVRLHLRRTPDPRPAAAGRATPPPTAAPGQAPASGEAQERPAEEPPGDVGAAAGPRPEPPLAGTAPGLSLDTPGGPD